MNLVQDEHTERGEYDNVFEPHYELQQLIILVKLPEKSSFSIRQVLQVFSTGFFKGTNTLTLPFDTLTPPQIGVSSYPIRLALVLLVSIYDERSSHVTPGDDLILYLSYLILSSLAISLSNITLLDSSNYNALESRYLDSEMT